MIESQLFTGTFLCLRLLRDLLYLPCSASGYERECVIYLAQPQVMIENVLFTLLSLRLWLRMCYLPCSASGYDWECVISLAQPQVMIENVLFTLLSLRLWLRMCYLPCSAALITFILVARSKQFSSSIGSSFPLRITSIAHRARFS
jgi:hypothetical protein